MPGYLATSGDFVDHRLKYSADSGLINSTQLKARVFPEFLSASRLNERESAVDKLRNFREQIVVVTATIDRPDDIMRAYSVLERQQQASWSWVIIDNGRESVTENRIKSLNDKRIIYLRYLEKTGCAYPVRNMGLDIVQLAKNRQNQSPFVIVVDSDDRLYGEQSLKELLKIASSDLAKRKGVALLHGYSATEIHESGLPILNVPNPRDWDSRFPDVNNLKEVFDKGLNILSGMFPIELLSFLRYPEEFSFEDDGFNQKLLLQAKRLGLIWIANRVPTTIKIFHQNSMSERNNQLGDTFQSGNIGLHKVKGIRAKIVSYLKDITDYYTREGL